MCGKDEVAEKWGGKMGPIIKFMKLQNHDNRDCENRQSRRMKTFIVSLFPALLLSLAQPSFAADSLSETLQRGLFEEEANHNLEGAIKAYQSVLQQTDEQRKLAATAVFRLGECYRKLGKTNEASAQYERILREFSDQTALVDLSRQHVPQSTATSGESLELAKARAELARRRVIYGEENPEVRQQLAVVQSLERSLAQRGPVPGEAAPTDEEQKEIQRIKAMIKDSPDLINGRGAPNSGLQTQLHEAARVGHLTVAQFLLANGADVDALDSQNQTPLHYAAMNGHKSMVELLLANKAAVEPKPNPTTPLHLAAANGYKLVASVLLAHGANVNAKNAAGWTPLHFAAVHGYTSVAELLIENKADVNATSTGGQYELGGNFGKRLTPLHVAAIKSQTTVLNLLCEHGADVNAKDIMDLTPLHYAVSGPKVVVQTLLAKNAEVNAKDNEGITPLLNAIVTGNAQVVELLLSHGADVNAQTGRGNSPVIEAANKKSGEALDVLKLVLAHKPDLEVRDSEGLTPLQRAVLNDSDKVVEMLLGAGASPNVTNTRGSETPLHWAAARGKKKIVELLLAHQANVNAQSSAGDTPYDFVKPVPRSSVPGSQKGPSGSVRPEIAELLLNAGAKEDLQRLSHIGLSRNGGTIARPFTRGTNDQNNYTLLELFATFFASTSGNVQFGAQLQVPDFSRLTIQRLKPDGATEEIQVDLEQAIQTGDCSKDIPLRWGDIVEVPALDHRLNEPWGGLSAGVRSFLQKCLERHVEVRVKGEPHKITLRPKLWNEMFPAGVLSTFRLRNVVYVSSLLLASSDVTHLKVLRKDPASGRVQEMMFNLQEQTNPDHDLWLRDGDVIEVPEK
jgi:ankyrin repeat protein